MTFRRLSLLLLSLFLTLPFLSAQMRVDRDEYGDRVRGELYFRIDPASDIELDPYDRSEDGVGALEEHPWLASLIEPFGITRIHCPFRTPGAQNIYKLHFTEDEGGKAEELMGELQSAGAVIYAEPVRRYRSFYQPDDIAPEQAWYLDSIQAEKTWEISKGDPDVTIAIVDDAINSSHPDLQGAIAQNDDEIPGDGYDNDLNGYVDDVGGWDAADQDNDPEPPSSHPLYGMGVPIFSHGTHTAGIASGATDNGVGIAGMGFNSSIIPIKTVSDDSPIPLGIEAPAEGVDHAIAREADIISMSFGGVSDRTLVNLLKLAHQDSILLIAAAGNDGASDTLWPAGMEEVIAVGSTTREDLVSDFSQHGDWIDLMAPGDSLYSTYWEGGSTSSTYAKQAGTSMACPLVAGVASLMMSKAPSATPSQIRHCLKEGCVNIDDENPSYLGQMGAGRLNAHQALTCIRTSSLREEGAPSVAMDLYPNPTRDRLRFRIGDGFEPQGVEVLGMTGRKVRKFTLNGERKGSLDLKELPEGLYLLRFRSEKGKEFVRKVSVVR